MEHLNIRITGNVQGVFFRHSARKCAREFGVFGFARNEPEGTVYMEVEGEKDALEKFVEWAKQGSPAANVKKVTVEKGEIQEYKDFSIEF